MDQTEPSPPPPVLATMTGMEQLQAMIDGRLPHAPIADTLGLVEFGGEQGSISVALVPELDARSVVWRAHAAAPAPYVDERESASELRLALATVTQRLVDLDVASWSPEVPDLLMNLRHRPALPLPPVLDPRRRETLERAALCLDVVDAARADEGGALSTHEVVRRRAALADLDRAARRAVVGACTGRHDR